MAAIVVGGPGVASADAVLLLGESYGRFGAFSPTGHTAVYLTRVCAETPTELRRCEAGETGAVISRYHRVGGRDWVAVPLIPYLYAVEKASDVPEFATAVDVLALRDSYRRARFADLVPDAPSNDPPKGDWVQLVGSAYDRRIIAFSVATTPEQDDELIAELNGRANRKRFNLLLRNCADFAKDIINFYHPRAMRSSFLADLGLTTPKQISKSLVKYGSRRPEVQLSAYVVPQIPGSRRESRHPRGVLEGLVKTKKYLVPLAFAHPGLPVGLAAGYLLGGRFDPMRHAIDTLGPDDIEQRAIAGSSLHGDETEPF